jgi:hypothetical protein
MKTQKEPATDWITPPACRESLGNPVVPLWFVEGVKKADSLASRGECAVTLTGVWNFKGRNALGGTTILADFDYIALKDRETIYVLTQTIGKTSQ